jgi:hypothetical protein
MHPLLPREIHPRPSAMNGPRPRRFFYAIAIAAVLIFAGMAVPSAQAVLVTYFNFEDSVLGGPVDFTSDAPGQQSSLLVLTFPGSIPTSVAGLPLNVAAGDPQPNLLGAGFRDTKAGQADLTFAVTTTQLAGLSLSFAINTTGNGFNLASGSYSLDGTTFTSVGSVALTTSSTVVTFTFPTAVDNQTSVLFRISLTGGQSNGQDLQTILDNIQLIAAVPEPGTWVGASLALAAIGFTQRRRFRRRPGGTGSVPSTN